MKKHTNDQLKAAETALDELIDGELEKMEGGKPTELMKKLEAISSKVAGARGNLAQLKNATDVNESETPTPAMPKRNIASELDNQSLDDLYANYLRDSDRGAITNEQVISAVDEYAHAKKRKEDFIAEHQDIFDEKKERTSNETAARRRAYALLSRAAAEMDDDEFDQLSESLPDISGFGTSYEVRYNPADAYQWARENNQNLLILNERVFEKYVRMLDDLPYYAQKPDNMPPAEVVQCIQAQVSKSAAKVNDYVTMGENNDGD